MKTFGLESLFISLIVLSTLSSNAQSPAIDAQPQSQAVIAGLTVVFEVTASGAEVPDFPQVSSGTNKLWLKADAGVVKSANRVTLWQDLSPNANHASQTNINNQPLFVDSAIQVSGKPAVRFDGIQDGISGDWMQGTNLVGIADGYTSFLVYRPANRTIAEQVLAAVGVPAQGGALRSYYVRGDGEMAFAGWANEYGTGYNIPPETCRIWTDRLNHARSQLELFDVTATNEISFLRSTGGLTTPGPGYYLGGLGQYTRNFEGDIAELIIYQGALTDMDRLAVQNYLKLKYFQASIPGGGTLTYQWRFNGTNLIGATHRSFAITNVQSVSAGNYSVIVSNNFGGTESESVVLTVNNPPSILAQPQDLVVLPGTNASFNVVATGTMPLSYQWFFNGSVISNATSSSYSINSAHPTNVGSYFVVISNVAGIKTSESATLQIPVMPSITAQPEGRTDLAGVDITLSVTAENRFPIVTSGNLCLWLKADQGVILEAGRVAQWRDQSTNANHAFQSNTLNQPLYIGSAVPVSGKPSVRFDGIQNVEFGDWMHGAKDVGLTAGYTSFLVYRRAPRSIDEQIPAAIGIPDQDSSLRSYLLRETGEMAFAGWRNDYGTGYIVPADTYRIWTDRLNDSRTFLDLFDVTMTNTVSFARTTFSLGTPGAGYYLGGLGEYTRNFEGEISELIVYQGALSDPDRLAVQNYLKGKYFSTLPENSLSYQWRLDGNDVPGATNFSLVLSNIQPAQSGSYTVVLTNLVGSVTSSPALVKISYIFPTADGARITSQQYISVDPVSVGFEPYFQDGMVFYTLDGTTPNFTSEFYTAPFTLTQSATVRAIIYSVDFMQFGESVPLDISIVPTYSLSTSTAGGGSIAIAGINPFASNAIVNVIATASNGWTFLQWTGDATGTNPMTSVTMTTNKMVGAIFGTTLNATAAGNGSISIHPALNFYPYGTVARLTAVPQPGNYFGIWGNAASGNTNPLYFPVINPNRTVSSLFSTLSAGQFSLTLSVNGSGRASANPRANIYNTGQNITLTATPDAGQTFLGWSGDASGSVNPLNVTMNQSRYITANFTKSLKLAGKFASLSGQPSFQLMLTGELGEVYSLQRSTDLVNWPTITFLTNAYGTVGFSDTLLSNAPQNFYRATQP